MKQDKLGEQANGRLLNTTPTSVFRLAWGFRLTHIRRKLWGLAVGRRSVYYCRCRSTVPGQRREIDSSLYARRKAAPEVRATVRVSKRAGGMVGGSCVDVQARIALARGVGRLAFCGDGARGSRLVCQRHGMEGQLVEWEPGR